MAANDTVNSADEYRKAHGGSIEGYSGDDVSSAVASSKYDPRSTTASQGEGAPKREQFDAGLPGDAAYAKAVRRYQKLKSDGQSKALDGMKTPGGD
jgi:hypothetical protein